MAKYSGEDQLTDRLTVVTVAWNSGESLLRWCECWSPCGCRLLVADNGSTDGAPERCGADIVSTGGNMGFGGGINLAARAADTELVLITNPDTLPLTRSSVAALLERFEPGTLATGQLVDVNGRPIPSGGIWPSVPWVACQVLGRASSLWRQSRMDWIQGALMLVERDLFLKRLDGFSTNFPLYFEDTDLCARAETLGIERCLVTDAYFSHTEGTGAPSSAEARLAGFHWGLWQWFETHKPRSSSLVRMLLIMKCVGRITVGSGESRAGYRAALSSLVRGRRPELPEAV